MAELSGPTLLQDPQWPLGQNLNKWVSYPVPSMMAQNWPYDSQIINKKMVGYPSMFVLFI